MYLANCQIALKHFGMTKKNYQEPPVTFKIGVERTKLVECISLKKKKKAKNNTTAESHKKNSVRSSEKKRG